ncbi:hypothetical protein [Variovorax paradoxus]|uniref:Uncharacterized protein n=1 Tax=Variovorax paradoxus TaxID=34073 RepID=A0A679JCE1_VARPD|nr:hypothetical protein VVAX_04381 [Variovorax paradoxus]
MSTDKTERAALLPCPFCGCDADTEHSDDCYFTVQEKLTAAPLADVSLVTFARVAWNRRVAALPSQPATVVQPVGTLTVSKFRGHLENTAFDYTGSLPDGTYSLYAHPSAPAESGWQWVPVEPTDDMEVAAENDYESTGVTFPDWKSAYRSMLKAAPSAAQPGGADGGAS